MTQTHFWLGSLSRAIDARPQTLRASCVAAILYFRHFVLIVIFQGFACHNTKVFIRQHDVFFIVVRQRTVKIPRVLAILVVTSGGVVTFSGLWVWGGRYEIFTHVFTSVFIAVLRGYSGTTFTSNSSMSNKKIRLSRCCS